MPFTASHIAAVLPLARTPLVASALVIGSMAPDLPYFVPLPVGAATTHSLVGVVSVDVLLGLAIFVVWHGVLVRPALAAGPASLRERVPTEALRSLGARLSSVRALLLVCLSLAVGALTHVVWDAFTHKGAWGAERVSWLTADVGPVAAYQWAQYGSGVVGALIVALWLVRWWRRTSRLPADPAVVAGPRTTDTGLPAVVAVAAWLAIIVAGVVAAAVASWAPLTERGGPYLREAAVHAVTHSLSAAGLVTVLLAASWHGAAALGRVGRGRVARG